MASEELLKVSKDEIERARLLSELKYELDMQNLRVTAQREGREEGIQEGIAIGREEGQEIGREKAQLESVKNLHKFGLPAEQIAAALELPLETIKQYLNGRESP